MDPVHKAILERIKSMFDGDHLTSDTHIDEQASELFVGAAFGEVYREFVVKVEVL